MYNEQLAEVFYTLWKARRDYDDETAGALLQQLLENGWSEAQIEFYLAERNSEYARVSRQKEWTSRRNAVIISFLVAIPTMIISVAFQRMALSNDFFILAQLERWYGGIVVGALSSLAVNDYRLWLENDLRGKNLPVLESAKVLLVWKRQNWRQKASILLRPSLLRSKSERASYEESEMIAMWQRASAAWQLQGFLLLRFSQRGWRDFWKAVNVEKKLGPSQFFLALSLLCSLPVMLESVSAGISTAVAAYLLADVVVPLVSVANIYLPSLLSGVSTGQSSNVVAAVRVLVVTFFMALVVGLELYFQHLGLPRIKLINLLNLF
jgi:hypothetical protein